MTHKKGTPSSCYSTIVIFFNSNLREMQMRWQEKITYRVCSFVDRNISPLIITVSFVRFFLFRFPTLLLVRFFTLTVVFGVKYHSHQNALVRSRLVYFRSSGLLRTNGGFGGMRLCACEKVHEFTLPYLGGGENLFRIKRKICLSIPLRHSTREYNRFDEFVGVGENSLMEWPSKRTLRWGKQHRVGRFSKSRRFWEVFSWSSLSTLCVSLRTAYSLQSS